MPAWDDQKMLKMLKVLLQETDDFKPNWNNVAKAMGEDLTGRAYK